MDKFQLIVEHTDAYQHVHLAVPYTIQQLHDQSWEILGQMTKIQDTPLTVNYAHRPGAKHAGLLDQLPFYNAMNSKQILHRIGVKRIQPFVDFIGVHCSCNVTVRSKNILTVENGSNLSQR